MKILISAFEPFGEHQTNASQQILKQLPDRPNITKRFLETVKDKAPEKLLKDITDYDALIMLGLAGDRERISIERFALNINHFRIQDNQGHQPTDEPIQVHGPDAYQNTLPHNNIIKELKQNQIECELSYHAGTYVCNHLFYKAAYTLNQKKHHIPFGFVHVPMLDKVSLDTQVKAIELMIKVLESQS